MAPQQISCTLCGSKSVIPILYGMKQPKRDFDLHLMGKLVFLAGVQKDIGKPLWACADCFALIDQPRTRIADSEQNATAHYNALQSAFEAYIELSDTSRAYLIGRSKLRDLLRALTLESQSQCAICEDVNGAVVGGIDDDQSKFFECDKRTFDYIFGFCHDNSEFLLDGQIWDMSTGKKGFLRDIKIAMNSSKSRIIREKLLTQSQ